MKYFRFMSLSEFDKLINKEKLYNNTKHDGRTNSLGFCFMNLKDDEPEEAYEYLSGVVSEEVCVLFETNKKLKESWGIYADPYGAFFDTIIRTEYCTTQYSIEDFKILKVAIPDLWEKWKWYQDIEKFLTYIKNKKQKEREEQKRSEEIAKIRKEIEINKQKDLFEAMQSIKEDGDMHLKIKDKYYKVYGYIDSIEHCLGRTELTMKILI